MARTPFPAAVAVAASTILLLTACGGASADDPDRTDPSASATPSGAASPSATETPAEAANAVQRPLIKLPAGTENVFEGQHTGDPKKDAVLADNAEWVNSMDESILEGSQNPAIGFYSTDKALEGSATFVQGYLDKGHTWVGVTRFFDRKVSFNSDGSAGLIYCSDETKSYIKDLKTGKVNYSMAADPRDDYVLYNTKLVKNAQGIWQTVSVLSDRGAEQCQP
ncbi:hypothetical protein AB0J90_18060 [Micromonospora sp. NPDC049523]|uniref:hypothetical protein n=1 Tax=Micromonospora sp. NPDC049523 TaxID=3155921 RepID=UPI0034447BB6